MTTRRTKNPGTCKQDGCKEQNAIRSGVQREVPMKSEERDVPWRPIFPRCSTESCSTYCRGRNYACTAETNIQPMRNSPRPSLSFSSSPLLLSEQKGRRWERMFEITSQQTASVSLLDKTCTEYERYRALRSLNRHSRNSHQNRLVLVLIIDFLSIFSYKINILLKNSRFKD